MNLTRVAYELESKIKIEKAVFRGSGILILTGPSSCGKGEVADALCKVLSIPKRAHLAMGDILRQSFQKSKENKSYSELLAKTYQISANSNIFDCIDTNKKLTKKVLSYVPDLEKYFKKKDMHKFTSQLEWLEFCTMNGLLVPNRWTENFISAHIEHDKYFKTHPFILDGYPRTVRAAEHLLGALKNLNIPVIKVLHLSISKQEMLSRASKRNRADDETGSLLSRYKFYVENVHPSIDYLKTELGSESVALIDAHQPVFDKVNGRRVLNVKKSILNVVASSLRNLGVSRITVKDLIETLS